VSPKTLPGKQGFTDLNRNDREEKQMLCGLGGLRGSKRA
jgi:hypothetical protein